MSHAGSLRSTPTICLGGQLSRLTLGPQQPLRDIDAGERAFAKPGRRRGRRSRIHWPIGHADAFAEDVCLADGTVGIWPSTGAPTFAVDAVSRARTAGDEAATMWPSMMSPIMTHCSRRRSRQRSATSRQIAEISMSRCSLRGFSLGIDDVSHAPRPSRPKLAASALTASTTAVQSSERKVLRRAGL